MAKMVNLQENTSKYDTFINDVLKEDLKKLESRLQQVNAEIADLIQQKQALKVLTDKKTRPGGFKTQVNLGSNFFMEASVTDTSKMLMNIGLKHYLEFTLLEANQFLTARIDYFEQLSKELQEKAVATKAHIKFMLMGLSELQKEVKKT